MNKGMLLRFVFAFVVYAVIDVGWNISPIATGMYDALHEASGNEWWGNPELGVGKGLDAAGGLEFGSIIAFMALIAFANIYLAVEPALRDNDLKIALKNSFVLGCAAYATYIAPVFLTFANWPAALVPIDILIGGLLSLITSAIVTSVALRIRNR